MALDIPLPGPENDRAYLLHYGFDPPRLKAYIGIFLLLLFTAAAIYLGYHLHDSLGSTDFSGADVATMILALGALVIGYQQWREAREETSMEKYYERLDMANRRREQDSETVHSKMKNSIPELADEPPSFLMYVYVELDNLEYLATKYRLGYMRHGQARRGLHTFQRRCKTPEFKRVAAIRVMQGDYRRYTANIVRRVCEEMNRI